MPTKYISAITFCFFGITVIGTLAVLINLYCISYHHWPLALRVYVPGVVMTFALCKLFGLVFVIADDLILATKTIIRKLKPASNKNKDGTISRKEFLSKAAIAAMAIPFAGLIYGMVRGAFNYDIKKVTLKLKNLPTGFEGLKIVQFSDIHAGSFISNNPVQEIVDLVNEQNADVVFFTGDLVNEKASEADPYIKTLSKIKASMGVFSILGNHDYGDYFKWDNDTDKANNLAKVKQHHADMGWNLLLNDSIMLKKGADEIALIGMENWGKAKRFQKLGDLDVSMKGIKNDSVKLLLSHDPSFWDYHMQGKQKEIDITFSGHTHGMQFGVEIPWFRWSPSKYFYKQWAGMYSDADNQQLYVNRGVGFIGYPGRLGISPEITMFTLEKS